MRLDRRRRYRDEIIRKKKKEKIKKQEKNQTVQETDNTVLLYFRDYNSSSGYCMEPGFGTDAI